MEINFGRFLFLLGCGAILLSDLATARRGGARFRGSSRYTRYQTSSYILKAQGGSRMSSTYITYQPQARRIRTYTSSYSTYYSYYYNLYFYNSGSVTYLDRQRPGEDVYVCANYEANENGTTMGVFTCPNTWEPDNFVNCCGNDYAQYCCKESLPLTRTQRIALGVGLGLAGVVLAILYFVYKHYCKSTPQYRAPPTGVTPVVQINQTRHIIIAATNVTNETPSLTNGPQSPQPGGLDTAPHNPTSPNGLMNNGSQNNTSPSNTTSPPPYDLAILGYQTDSQQPKTAPSQEPTKPL